MPSPKRKVLTPEEKSARYDELYKLGQDILDETNPCNIRKKGKLTVCNGHPTGFREWPNSNAKTPSPMLCCINCGNAREGLPQFSTTNKASQTGYWKSGIGCTTKNLACKLYLCAAAERNKKGEQTEAYKLLLGVRALACEEGLPLYFFRSKDEAFAEHGEG